MRRVATAAALVAVSLLAAGCDGTDGSGEAVTTSAKEPLPAIVIESPLPGESVTSPIRVTGTANVFEATVSFEVRDAADAVVILTDHDVFDYEMVATSAAYVFDTRNRCKGDRVERL